MAAAAAAHTLSQRGTGALASLAPYFSLFEEALGAAYHPIDRPDGYVVLAVAENALNTSMARERLVPAASAMTASTTGYDNMRGRPSLRASFTRMMQRTVLRSTVLSSEHMVLSSGVGGVINHLSFLLLNPREGVLLPTPTYAALYNDVSVISQGVIVDVPCEGEGFRLTRDGLEAAIATAAVRVRAVMVLNPNNPLGTVYSQDELRVVLGFCAERGLHLICDEIYANSVWGHGVEFTSILDVVPAAHEGWSENHLHVLWGCSKDWGLGGFRVGALYTRNAAILQAMGNINYFTTASNYTQDALAVVFDDVPWCDAYLKENHRLLREAYSSVTDTLTALRLPFTPAQSGMFVWADLRRLLRDRGDGASHTFEDEEALTRDMFATAKVLFTPGGACHSRLPGFYRICYAYVTADALAVALLRLREFCIGRGVLPVPD